MSDSTFFSHRLEPVLEPPRVNVASALDRLRILSSSSHPADEVMDHLVDVVVPAVADRCVLQVSPDARRGSATTPALRTTPGAVARTATVRAVHSVSVSFVSTVDEAFRGSMVCEWDDGYQPSGSDAALVRAIVDQGVLLAERTRLSEEMEHLQAHAGQLQSAVESNRRIGAAIGVLMVRHGLTENDALDALRHISNTSNRKVRDVADEVLYTGSLPHRAAPRPATARAH